ncbi:MULTISPECIES: recombinase family protein [unclassified Microcoleus]|uniref:recombinase family protein n=1 Tax=unclassified Microcoleus TaxID=2642155 RepID=UPI001D9179F0|nr:MULTISPECIES: recombinase family protein [unclassified Microcoleus]TAF84197.1 MAG: recombinase family protein [Oscillatoriales cyanobacterium]MCC3451280.1 recombinase family protein [Microcoleus sp. PH2017_09_SFU_O_A]MCC3472294.1 recombinase family protein [Microcoleus sp. PH2017_13_LAR_U_A]MCC3483963.1 recombinase family protein [Microcoleus sp. PH2017_14_LAR_D_A]MCC3632186.1 recombinase family protein [Microcoleus sp. PH2017_39_LGB_O_B]
MKIIAYSYTEPLLEAAPAAEIWGQEVDRTYQDLGGRQQLQQLLKDCQTEPVKYLLIQRFEELGDTVQQVCAHLEQLENLGIQLIVTDEKQTENRVNLLKLLAELQRSQHSRSIRKGHARNRIKSLPPPGKAPYGYRRGKDKYAIDKTASPAVKDFFEHFLIYGSLRGSVRHLAKKYNKKISVSTGRRWLTNPAYRGDLEYQNGQVISNTHIPIISREEAAQVDRLLRRNSRLAPRSASAPRSLAGLAICAECKSSMTVAKVTAYRKDKEYLYLRPINCSQQPKCSGISYEEVLQLTIAGICRDLPDAIAQLQMPDIQGIKAGIAGAIASKQKIIEQLPALIESGILDAETADLRSYKIRTEVAELQSKLAKMPPVNLRETAQTVSLPQFWLDLSESERRFYFREFIDRIEIIRENSEVDLQIIFIF